MSDRRSFSEIPVDAIRDHGVEARVERVWSRLREDLVVRRRPGRSRGFAITFAFGTFVLGVIVGARLFAHQPIALSSLGAEPIERLAPAAAPASRPASNLGAATPGDVVPARPPHRAAGARHADVVTSEPAPEPAAAGTPAEHAASPEWQRLADEGQYAEASAALESAGGFDAALRGASTEELMSLVDVARATGQRDRGILALRRIVNEHGADPNAPVAAWMLGNELAKVRDFTGAEQAFAMYRALSPGGDFAEDALARQIDMASEQGNMDHASTLAAQYLKEFPDGPRTADIRTELDRWASAKPAPSGDAPASPAGEPLLPDAGVPR